MKLTDNDIFQVGIKALIRNSRGEVLVLHDQPYRGRSKDLPIYWDLPGGRIKDNHNLLETLTREVKEETGIKNIQINDLVTATTTNFKVVMDGYEVRLMILVYECKIIRDYQIALSEEHQNYGWFTPQKTAELLSIKYPKEFTDIIRRVSKVT